jgi:pterin-4a-carbinolamine dehydratase
MTDQGPRGAKADRPAREGKEPKRSWLDLMKDWQVADDGRSVTRKFSVAEAREASKMASRVVSFSYKNSLPVDIHCDGTTITISMQSSASHMAPTKLLDRKQRGLARRLDRLVPEKGDEAA